jgi:hypothetical protein
VRNLAIFKIMGMLVVLSGGVLLTGCKSAPDLSAADAQKLIQAHYDATPAAGANLAVDDLGMRQGFTAKYWVRTKEYPNKYWADFTLTPDGKKVVALPSGKDVIEWRPESADDKNYSITVISMATNHLKARDVKDPQDEVGGTKASTYTESVSLDGVPPALQDIAHNPGNQLSFKRTATFALDGGAWKVQSIN